MKHPKLKVKVSNMTTSSGREVPNQFIIETNEGEYFQSYNSTIGVRTPKGIVLDKDAWDYSATTGKYRNQWLGEGISETRKKIADGTYKLESLN